MDDGVYVMRTLRLSRHSGSELCVTYQVPASCAGEGRGTAAGLTTRVEGARRVTEVGAEGVGEGEGIVDEAC